MELFFFYRGGIFKKALFLFVISFLALGYLGTQPVTPLATTMARLFTTIYFGFFLLMPIYTRWEKTKPVPRRLTKVKSIEDQLHEIEEQIPALLEEITEVKPAITEIGHPAFKGTFFSRRPNPKGIAHVLSRVVTNLKRSLD